MAVIGEGSSLVALVPGALEALVANVRERFAPASHSHGTAGIEDGAVTADKLSADALASLGGVSASDLYDVLFEDDEGATGSSSVTLSKRVTGYGATPYRRVVIYYWASGGGQGERRYGSTAVEMTSPMEHDERHVDISISTCSGTGHHYQYFLPVTLSGSRLSVYAEYRFATEVPSGRVEPEYAMYATGEFRIHITRVEGWRV